MENNNKQSAGLGLLSIFVGILGLVINLVATYHGGVAAVIIVFIDIVITSMFSTKLIKYYEKEERKAEDEAYELLKDYIKEESKNIKPVSLDELDKYDKDSAE